MRRSQRDLYANEPVSILVLKGAAERSGGKKHLSTDPSAERETGREGWRCELFILVMDQAKGFLHLIEPPPEIQW